MERKARYARNRMLLVRGQSVLLEYVKYVHLQALLLSFIANLLSYHHLSLLRVILDTLSSEKHLSFPARFFARQLIPSPHSSTATGVCQNILTDSNNWCVQSGDFPSSILIGELTSFM